MEALVDKKGVEPGELDELLCAELVARGKLGQADADRALKIHERELQTGDTSFALLLAKLDFASDSDIAEALSSVSGIPMARREQFPQQLLEVDRQVSVKFLQDNRALILEERDDLVTVVMADPHNTVISEAIRLVTAKAVLPRIGIASEIDAALEQRVRDDEQSAADTEDAEDSTLLLDDVARLKELASEAPVIKLVNQLIDGAVVAGASDIHIEPFESRLVVRYRIDGVLHELEEAPILAVASAVVSRVKIMANLNIAERRLPQDGRFKHRSKGGVLDLRISTIPTMDGESVVMRLLHRNEDSLELTSLGFSGEKKQLFLELLDRPNGIILVTGPTGSGKTTTLYTALKYLNEPTRKIITVEDPVEYKFEGVNQIQTKSQIGLTFANALRSIVRQDPDVIMIGEMRDQETAKIAVQSALTGHLVLSTIHTNDAVGTISRLLDMGVDDFLLTSTVTAILAQRLVRRLCTHCKQPYQPSPGLVDKWRLSRWLETGKGILFKPQGCLKCSGTGYEGRLAIVEMLVMDEALRKAILDRASSEAIAVKARAVGFESMFEDGIQRVIEGTTTLEEILRVTQEA